MKIEASRSRTHISVNHRAIGDGLVIMQGTNRLLLSRAEWSELREASEALLQGQR
jgi:hypothetical protein